MIELVATKPIRALPAVHIFARLDEPRGYIIERSAALAERRDPTHRHAGPRVDPGATQYYPEGRETPMTVKSSISLTDEQHAFARALVDAGRYSSLSAVLQQGVDLLRHRMDADELETEALRELLSRRRKGTFVDTEQMDARLAGMVADKRRAHGLPS